MDEYQKILQEAKLYLRYKNVLEDKELPNPLYLIMNLARLLRQHLEPAWNPVTQKPEKSGNYLVSLREDNSLEFNHKEPVIAQFGFTVKMNKHWSAFDNNSVVIIDDDVLWWSELPEAPKNPPFNVWIDWVYTPESPFPKLDGDPLVHVRFGDLSESNIERGHDARPISYWHDDGSDENDFAWLTDNKGGYKPTDNCIIAYMILDPNDHD